MKTFVEADHATIDTGKDVGQMRRGRCEERRTHRVLHGRRGQEDRSRSLSTSSPRLKIDRSRRTLSAALPDPDFSALHERTEGSPERRSSSGMNPPPDGCRFLFAPTGCRKAQKPPLHDLNAMLLCFCITAVLTRQTEGLLNILVPPEFLSRNTSDERSIN